MYFKNLRQKSFIPRFSYIFIVLQAVCDIWHHMLSRQVSDKGAVYHSSERVGITMLSFIAASLRNLAQIRSHLNLFDSGMLLFICVVVWVS